MGDYEGEREGIKGGKGAGVGKKGRVGIYT
jgi:hypothetical protein